MKSFIRIFFSFIITSLFLFPLLFVQNNETLSMSSVPLNGTYSTGAAGNYTTINSAVNDLVSLGVSGPVVFDYTDYRVSTGKYRYRLKQIDFNGQSEYFDMMNMVYFGIPQEFYLTQNYPNPFNPSTK